MSTTQQSQSHSPQSLANRVESVLSRPEFRTVLFAIYLCTVFTSAFLLFQVQPLIGRYILPWFGGSPAVWTTCMLVFQILLFCGYSYAHLLTSRLKSRHQVFVHCSLLVCALFTLPIIPDPSWKPTDGDWPVPRIVTLLMLTVGLPYVLLSSTGPLIQAWFAKSFPNRSPFRLYSLSNVGSLAALLSYPFLIETVFGSKTQAWMWSIGFGLFTTFCTACAILSLRLNNRVTEVPQRSSGKGTDHNGAWCPGSWFALSMIPSALLLAITNQVCLDVAVVPFLWIIPLTLYLLTFILCFDSEGWYRQKLFVRLTGVAIAAICWMVSSGASGGFLVQISVYFGGLFLACMLCHGELVLRKPNPSQLTFYYLTISAGGAAGGLFVGLLAPALFATYYELPLCLFAVGMVCASVLFQQELKQLRSVPQWIPGALATSVLILAGAGFSAVGVGNDKVVAVCRNFYGVLRVKDAQLKSTGEPVRQLLHGRIVHGIQYTSECRELDATAYYSPASGVGQILSRHAKDVSQNVGVIGLGIGSLATYGRPEDTYRFYEIDPDVVNFAKSHFTFLSKSQAKVSVGVADARLMLEEEAPQDFDVLVVDAFSGDAIPMHLLTEECGAIYLKHLSQRGILAIHISNLHFDLEPVVAGLAKRFQLEWTLVISESDPQMAANAAKWALLAREGSVLDRTLVSRTDHPPVKKTILWTDDQSNLFEIVR